MRQIVLDTETTGIDIASGNRMIEIGCVELINRKLTGNNYHQYINPQRKVEQGAFEVHGISDDFLLDKPLFSDVADEFMRYVDGAELVIHNAPFDVGFINHELALAGNRYGPVDTTSSILDTLAMAKSKHPGQRNSLDALCRRYGVDNSNRVLHGALLDAEILADVYLFMTGGQTGLELSSGSDSADSNQVEAIRRVAGNSSLRVLNASKDELNEHQLFVDLLNKKSDGSCQW
ncbi:DNA polymerase III subunit epsilon [BD1-7 clade bacterium]|nr:DNA polymerase III subunit epsilon [BD1-7 clade bacterium]